MQARPLIGQLVYRKSDKNDRGYTKMAMVNVVNDMRDLYIEHQSFKLKDFSVTNNIFYLLEIQVEWPPLASVSIFWRPYPMVFLSKI